MSAGVDVGSFEEFFRKEYAALVALGVWLTGERRVGEEQAQDALGITYRRWADVASYQRPGAFARRTMINLASNERRRQGRERRALRRLMAAPDPVWPQGGPTTTPSAPGPVWAEVTALPSQQRAAIGLRYVNDLTTAAIAEVLGCSEATVRVHLHRAHRRLAERLRALDVDTPASETEECLP